jgi:hypothetical protein
MLWGHIVKNTKNVKKSRNIYIVVFYYILLYKGCGVMGKQGKHIKNYKTISLEASTSDQIKYLSRCMGKSQLETLKEIFNHLVSEFYQFSPNSLNITYIHDESNNKITLEFDGSSNISQGQCTDKELTAMLNDKKVGL